MATRSTNTMSEGLTAMLGHIGQLMAAPDADIQTLSQLQSQVVGMLKAPQQAAMQQFAQAGGVTPDAGGGAPPMGGGPMDAGAAMGGPPPMGGPPGGMPGGGDLSSLLAGLGGGAPGGPTSPSNPYRPYGVHNGGTPPPPDELRRLIAGSA